MRIINFLKYGFELLKDAGVAWSEDKVPTLSASLSYYTVFSLGPLLLLMLSVAALVLGHGAAEKALVAQLTGLLGSSVAPAIDSILTHGSQHGTGLVGTMIGLVALALGAMGVFGQLQDSLNLIWDVAPKPGRGIKGLIFDRLLSMGMVAVICFLLLVSLGASALLSLLATAAQQFLPFSPVILEIINFLVSLLVVTGLFALIYKVLPDAQIPWRPAFTAALVTAVLFTIGKTVIGLYIGHNSTASAYGAAGSLIILLLWVYYSAQILLFGAELVKVLMIAWHLPIQPSQQAERGNVKAVEQPHSAGKTNSKLVDPTTAKDASPQGQKDHRDVGRSSSIPRWLGLASIGVMIGIEGLIARWRKQK